MLYLQIMNLFVESPLGEKTDIVTKMKLLETSLPLLFPDIMASSVERTPVSLIGSSTVRPGMACGSTEGLARRSISILSSGWRRRASRWKVLSCEKFVLSGDFETFRIVSKFGIFSPWQWTWSGQCAGTTSHMPSGCSSSCTTHGQDRRLQRVRVGGVF